MKKIKIILLTIIFIFPSVVKADMAAPMSNYKVRISNSNGAYIYERDYNQNTYVKTDYKVKYDEIVKIEYEITIDNQTYGGIVCSDEKKQTCGYINLSNTSLIDINLEDYYHETAKSYYVFDNTCYLYTGPSSNFYSKINPETSLDVGYTFTSNYYDDLWTYISEKKAWVYTYTYNKFSKDKEAAGVINTTYNFNENIITIEEVKIYDSPKTKEKVLGIIPANTELSIKYSYNMEPHYPFYYIEYNGIKGFIETLHDNETYAITNIAYKPTNSSLKVSNKDGVKLYKESDLNSEVITTIPYNADLTAEYVLYTPKDIWMYKVEYNGQVGWINNDYMDTNSTDEEEIKEDIPDELSEDLIEDQIEDDIIIDDNVNNKKISTRGVIIICIVVSILASITALISILLINKKKEQKNANKNIDNNN